MARMALLQRFQKTCLSLSPSPSARATGWEKLRSIRMVDWRFSSSVSVSERSWQRSTRGALKLAVARVGEEVPDDGVEALGFAGDDTDQGALIVGESGDGGQHLDRTGDGRERIANLMGDAGGQASDGGEAVAKTEFALEMANLGEVGKGVDVADGVAIGPEEGAAADAQISFSAPLGVCARTSMRGALGEGRRSREELLHAEPDKILLAAAQQNLGGGIDQLDGCRPDRW